jgi:hypothetical protein
MQRQFKNLKLEVTAKPRNFAHLPECGLAFRGGHGFSRAEKAAKNAGL